MFLSGYLVSLYERQIARAFQQKKGYLVLSLFNIALFPLLWPVYEESSDYDFVNGGVYATYPQTNIRILYGAGCYTVRNPTITFRCHSITPLSQRNMSN